MELDNDKCLELIDEYRKRPVLWDPKHKHYYLRNKKIEAWESISNTMGIEMQTAKHKMCSLLGSFRREKTKGKKYIGTGNDCREIPASRWFAFEKLKFLLDREDVRKIKNRGTSTKDFDMYEDDDSMITVEVSPDIGDDSQTDLATMAADYYYRNAAEDQVDEVSTDVPNIKNEELIDQPVPQVETFSPVRPETEFDLWARSLAVQLNNMETLRALRLQFQLQKILSEERIKFELEKTGAAAVADSRSNNGTSEQNGEKS